MQNTLTLMGVLGTDVELDDEDGRARFRLLITTRRWDRSASAWSSERTFVTVVCRQRLGHNVAARLAKGDPVVVTGRLRASAQEGRRNRLEVDAVCVGIDLGRVPVALGDVA